MYQPQTRFSHRIINTTDGGVAEQQQQQRRQNPMPLAAESRGEDSPSPASATTNQQGDKLCSEGSLRHRRRASRGFTLVSCQTALRRCIGGAVTNVF